MKNKDSKMKHKELLSKAYDLGRIAFYQKVVHPCDDNNLKKLLENESSETKYEAMTAWMESYRWEYKLPYMID